MTIKNNPAAENAANCNGDFYAALNATHAAAKAKASRKVKKALKNLPDGITAADVITADTVNDFATIIARTALRTVLNRSGEKAFNAILALRNGLNSDCKVLTEYYKQAAAAAKSGIKATVISDGYDVVQTANAFLWQFVGQPLNAPVDGGQTVDKKGNPLTIRRAAYKAVNRYIMNARQIAAKEKGLIIATDGNGNIARAPIVYALTTYHDITIVSQLITAAKLSPTQKQILKYRLSGKSRAEIAFLLSGLTVDERRAAMDKSDTSEKAKAARDILKKSENSTQKQIARMIAKFAATEYAAAAINISPLFVEKCQKIAAKK